MGEDWKKTRCVSRENNHYYLHPCQTNDPDELPTMGKKRGDAWYEFSTLVPVPSSNDCPMTHTQACPHATSTVLRKQPTANWSRYLYARYSKTRDRQVIVIAPGFKFDRVLVVEDFGCIVRRTRTDRTIIKGDASIAGHTCCSFCPFHPSFPWCLSRLHVSRARRPPGHHRRSLRSTRCTWRHRFSS